MGRSTLRRMVSPTLGPSLLKSGRGFLAARSASRAAARAASPSVGGPRRFGVGMTSSSLASPRSAAPLCLTVTSDSSGASSESSASAAAAISSASFCAAAICAAEAIVSSLCVYRCDAQRLGGLQSALQCAITRLYARFWPRLLQKSSKWGSVVQLLHAVRRYTAYKRLLRCNFQNARLASCL